MKIRLHGLPRTGTNWLEYTLKANFLCEVESASKHGVIGCPDRKDRPVIFITKHPLNWLMSVYDYGKNRSGAIFITESTGFETFLTSGITMLTGPKGMWFPNPIQVWNCMNHHYRTWQHAHHVRQEDFRPDDLEIIKNKWGLKPRNPYFNITDQSMNTNATPTGQRFRAKRQSDWYTPETMVWVMTQVNMRLMKELGYDTA